MGGMKLVSSSVYDESSSTPRVQVDVVVHHRYERMRQSSNPDPYRFTIEQTLNVNDRYLIALVTYPDCTTFEGRKILVFAGVTEDQLRSVQVLDPHFTRRKDVIAPIARFIPTRRGWAAAHLLCVALTESDPAAIEDAREEVFREEER